MNNSAESCTPYTRKEVDDLTYALREVFTIYGKRLEEQVERLWIKSLSGKSIDMLLRAIREYPRIGKYAPKPIDILELVAKYKVETKKPTAMNFGHGDPTIGRAWITYIREAHKFPLSIGRDVPSMPLDEALGIVQREAIKYNQIDALLPEHRP